MTTNRQRVFSAIKASKAPISSPGIREVTGLDYPQVGHALSDLIGYKLIGSQRNPDDPRGCLYTVADGATYIKKRRSQSKEATRKARSVARAKGLLPPLPRPKGKPLTWGFAPCALEQCWPEPTNAQWQEMAYEPELQDI